MKSKIHSFVDALPGLLKGAAQVSRVQLVPPRAAAFAELDPPLAAPLARAVASLGVERLYDHQARAIALARQGRDVVVATPTASGKSLVYALPALERLLAEPRAKALFLFPLKALEQDQLAAMNELAFRAGLGAPAAVYDGDTPQGQRRKMRENPPAIIISNPDMVHAGICAYPQAWSAFLGDLRLIVIDEVHAYRGVFGCHVAQVLRRLTRLAALRGARPSFVLCSATIANPGQHAQALTSRPFADDQVLDFCGAPAAGRWFALVNPVGAASTTASHLLSTAVRQGLSTICFTKSRIHTELIHSWVTRGRADLRASVAGYRAGFLPEERRRIERDLASGRLAGVVSTSALEMGIDIGGLDLCILVGYPGSQMNTWQRGGRVGRAGRESAVIVVAGPDALDQYFVKHPTELLGRPVEAATLDPDNQDIVAQHLLCAAAEEPLDLDDRFFRLERHAEAVAKLSAAGELLLDAQGRRYFPARQRPQRQVDLRGAGQSFAIVDQAGKVIGSIDGARAFKEGHPGAVYLHQTRSYEVTDLELVDHKIIARPRQVDYYTRARSEKETEILEETGRRPVANFLLRQGRLRVSETIVGYERRRISGQDLLGVYPLDLPPLVFETHGLWIDIEDSLRRLIETRGLHFMGAIHALEHAAIAMFPLFALCDRGDVGGISIPLHPQTGKAAVFIYDGVAGGVGLARRCFEVIEELLQRVVELLTDCPCQDGCPACVYSPKCGSGNKPLDKAGALLLCRALLGQEDIAALPAPQPAPPAIVARPAAPDGAMRYGVLDLETQRLAEEVGGWANTHLMRVSVAVLYDSQADSFEAFGEKDIARLLRRLTELELIVGFNILRFDYGVLGAYSAMDLARLPTLDLLADLHQALGHRLSLQALGEATLGAGKGADGLQAVQWWRQGQLTELTDYCRQDVALTRDLFLFGQERGHLLFERKGQGLLRAPVDWSWPSLRRRFP